MAEGPAFSARPSDGITPARPPDQESALGGTRTPNLLIRSQMLYPLSYERWARRVYGAPRPPVEGARRYCQGAQPDRCQMAYAASAFTLGS